MNYRDAIRYIESFVNYERLGFLSKEPFTLDRMRKLAKIFGNPERSFRVVHVAGSKGKGSIASFVSSILKEAGYKVGLYTSPHILDTRERIRIGNKLITKEKFAYHAYLIKRKLRHKELGFQPTYFEIMTILAFDFFRKNKIDFGVIEAGLGGRLDATNIVSPYISIISPISLDHTDILGKRLEEIAKEKAGIIKKKSVAILAPQKKIIQNLLKKHCKRLSVRLLSVGKDVTYKEVSHKDTYEVFNVYGRRATYKNLKIPLVGKHQIENASSAICAIEVLKEKDVKIKKKHIEKGLAHTRHFGRCEILKEKPLILLDGAQNKESAHCLKKCLVRNFNAKKRILVLGMSKKKDIKGLVDELIPLMDTIVLTRSLVERGESPEAMGCFIKRKKTVLTQSVDEAMEFAHKEAKPKDMILVTGSFFALGEAKRYEKTSKSKSYA